jgi:hypothetical protein
VDQIWTPPSLCELKKKTGRTGSRQRRNKERTREVKKGRRRKSNKSRKKERNKNIIKE